MYIYIYKISILSINKKCFIETKITRMSETYSAIHNYLLITNSLTNKSVLNRIGAENAGKIACFFYY